MDEREQAELQWIRQNRQREIDRAKKREKQLENIQSFEDLFEEEFYENIRRAKCSDRTLLKNHFEQNELIADMPVDLLINDNINADKTAANIKHIKRLNFIFLPQFATVILENAQNVVYNMKRLYQLFLL